MVRAKHSMKYGLPDPEDEGTMIFRNIMNSLLSDATHSGILASSAMQL